MRRDTTGGIGIGEASRALKRIGKSIGKKMARLPEGRYAIVLSSMVVAGTHRGAVRKFDVFGDPALAAAITEYSRSEERRVGKEWRSRGSPDH